MNQSLHQNAPLPPAVKHILIANVVIFILANVLKVPLENKFALWPITGGQFRLVSEWEPWQLITYGFLHGDFMHLLFNMFPVWIFGSVLEGIWGTKRFTLYYFACIFGAGITQTVVSLIAAKSGIPSVTIGASGATYGVLLAFGYIFPNRWIVLVIPPMPIKAKYLVLLLGGLAFFFGVTGTQQGVAHFGHLGGMFAGLLILFYWHVKKLE